MKTANSLKASLITFAFLLAVSCKKSDVSNPHPQPPPTQTTKYYDVIATAPSDVIVSPESSKVKEGESVEVTFRPKDGYRISAFVVDGKVITDSVNKLTLTNVRTNHVVEGRITDSLTKGQLNLMNQWGSGKWSDDSVFEKLTGNVFTDWQGYIPSSCEEDDYELYLNNFQYENHQNGTFCSISTEIIDAGQWSFSPNGKWLYLKREGSKDSLSVLKLTSTTRTTILSKDGYDYKVYSSKK